MIRRKWNRFTSWLLMLMCLEMVVVAVIPHHHHHHHVCLQDDSEYFCTDAGQDHHDADPEDADAETACITHFTAVSPSSPVLHPLHVVLTPVAVLPRLLSLCPVTSRKHSFNLFFPISLSPGYLQHASLRAPPAFIC